MVGNPPLNQFQTTSFYDLLRDDSNLFLLSRQLLTGKTRSHNQAAGLTVFPE
jgi:hypothetical protein